MKKVLKKLLICGLTFLAGATFSACKGGDKTSTSTNIPTPSQNEKSPAEKFLDKALLTFNDLKQGNYTVSMDTRQDNRTYYVDKNAVKVGNEYYNKDGNNIYYFYSVDGTYHRRLTEKLPTVDFSGITLTQGTEATATVKMNDENGSAYYVDSDFVIETTSGTMTFSDIKTTSVSLPTNFVNDDLIEENRRTAVALIEQMKTQNYKVECVVDGETKTFFVDGNKMKEGTTVYEKANGKDYIYTYNNTENVYYRAEGLPEKEFRFSTIEYMAFDGKTSHIVDLDGSRYTVTLGENNTLEFSNSKAAFTTSGFGTITVDAITNYVEQQTAGFVDENGRHNIAIVANLFTNWMNGDNQFGKTVYKAKGTTTKAFDKFMLADFDENGFVVYATSKALSGTTTDDFRKIYFNSDTFEAAVASATTEDEFVAALNALTLKEIKFSTLLNIDRTLDQDGINTRTVNALGTVGIEAQVLFAFETPVLGEDLSYGNGIVYDTAAFLADGSLVSFESLCLSRDRVERNETNLFRVERLNVEQISEENLDMYVSANANQATANYAAATNNFELGK